MKTTELDKLQRMLEEANIPFKRMNHPFADGAMIGYPNLNLDVRVCSIIETEFSYGGKNDLLEIMGLLTDQEAQRDSVVGYLNAENVFARIKKDFEKTEER